MSAKGSSEPLAAAGAPAPVGPYAPGRTGSLSGRWVVTSGQIGLDPATGAIVPGGIPSETDRVLQNLRAILEAGGSGLGSVVKTTVYLIDMADFGAMNQVYARWFGEHKPSRTTIAVTALPLGARVEIEAWAFEP
jgi:2-iminobutanoate/2-iminopropanoate deaminase